MNSQDWRKAMGSDWRSVSGAETLKKMISRYSESNSGLYSCLLIMALLAVLAAGLWGRYSAATPLDRDLISLRLKLVATQIDSLVGHRSAIITTAAGESELEKIIDNQKLDSLVKVIQDLTTDFSSFEVINDHGEVLAMVGDLALSQAGSTTVRGANFVPVNQSIPLGSGFLIDDPANGSFYVVCRHIGADKIQWFSRTKFSRDSLEKILGGNSGYSAVLYPLSGTKSLEAPLPNSKDTGTFAISVSSSQGQSRAECILKSSGLLIRMEKNATATSFTGRRLTWVILAVMGILGIVALCLRAFRPMVEEWGDHPVTAPPLRNIQFSNGTDAVEVRQNAAAQRPAKQPGLPPYNETEAVEAKARRVSEDNSISHHPEPSDADSIPSRIARSQTRIVRAESLDLNDRESERKVPPSPVQSTTSGSAQVGPTIEAGSAQPHIAYQNGLGVIGGVVTTASSAQCAIEPPLTCAANTARIKTQTDFPETIEVTWVEPDEESAQPEEKARGHEAVRLSEFFTF